MKALIFNSGIGKRMGELTQRCHKSMVKLPNGESVFGRQLRLLMECGITQIVVTTGPFEEQLKDVARHPAFRDLHVEFVKNPLYESTNYIYSAYLAREYLDDDLLTLHGDLVFDKRLLQDILKNPTPSLATYNKALPLPEKDFKARIEGGKIREVGIGIFDDNCYAFQPMYKLCRADAEVWMERIVAFIEQRRVATVYAENAFNEVSERMNVAPFSYEEYYVNEIDNAEDYERVSREIRLFDFAEQNSVIGLDGLKCLLAECKICRPLVVMDGFLQGSEVEKRLRELCSPTFFFDFHPNPCYEDAVCGLRLYRREGCDGLISVGGGSAIDTAKAIKMFYPMNEGEHFLKQEHTYCHLPHIAIPTTAGTGSESTRFSVIYFEGEKQSLHHDDIFPTAVLLNGEFLQTLPHRQKAATLLDALAQAIESLWSVNSTEDSMKYASYAIEHILRYYQGYIRSGENAIAVMLAANVAGKAINLTQTTAAHAMSYKLTSLFGLPHGQAVALSLPYTWELLAENMQDTFDPRGATHIAQVLERINRLFGQKTTAKTVGAFRKLVQELGMDVKPKASEEQLEILASSVNTQRLKNFPVALNKEQLKDIYRKICE